jgi:Ssp1 endopeptidase immunity protein Rap1a
MNQLRIIAAAITLTIWSSGTLAVGWTGNDILSKCNDENTFPTGTCMGYILGVFDVLELEQSTCPGPATNGQKVDVVLKYLRENPAIRHSIAPILLLTAAKDAFPCK